MATGKRLKSLILATLTLGVFCAFPALSLAGDPGSTAGTFLRFAPGPRGTGMGEAYTAVTEDAYSTWWNPAGLASVEVAEAGGTYNSSMESVSHQYLSAAYPLRYGSTLGFSMTRLSVAPFQGYDAAGYKTSKVDSSETAFAGAYGRTLLKDEIERPVLNVGANLKAINSRLDTASASALALDLGAIYYLRPSAYWAKNSPAQEFRFAFSLKNVGTGLKYDRESFALPRSATLGAAWVSHPWGAHTLTVALDQTISNDDSYTAAMGAEYFMFQLLSFRAGYKTGQDIGSGLRAGLGFRLAFADLDYSMSPFGELGAMHKLGFSMRFGSPKSRQPLKGATSRVSAAKLMSPKDKLEKLEGYAADYIELARKDLAGRRYTSAQANFGKAFNLEPALSDGPWGDQARRLDTLAARLRLPETPARETVLQGAGDQARVAAAAVTAYLEARELKSFLLAHAALGADIRGDSVFEELLHSMGELTRNSVRRDEILPLEALVKEKLKKSARYFYIQQFDMSARECEEVTLLDEANPMGWARLGSSYYMLGDKDKARKAYEKALELDPNDRVTAQFMISQGWSR